MFSLVSPLGDPSSSSSSETSGHRHEAKEDPEVIKQWKEAQIIKLEAKDREEEKAKQILKQQAKKELEDWYKQHSEQVKSFCFCCCFTNRFD
jgi:hypothetical protein